MSCFADTVCMFCMSVCTDSAAQHTIVVMFVKAAGRESGEDYKQSPRVFSLVSLSK